MNSAITIYRAKLSIIILYALIFVLILLRISITQSYSVRGTELGGIWQEIETLKQTNATLRQAQLEARSLRMIEARAKQLGFINGSTLIIK